MNIAVINLLRIGDVFQTIPLLLWLKKHYSKENKNEVFNLTLITDNIDIDIIKQLSIVDDIIKIDYRKMLSSISSSSLEIIPSINFLEDLPFKLFDTVFNLGTNQISCLIANHILSDNGDYDVKNEIIGPFYDSSYFKNKKQLFTENNLTLNNQFRYLHEISIYKDLSVINLAEIYLSFALNSKSNKYLSEFSSYYNNYYKKSLSFFNEKRDKNRLPLNEDNNKSTIVINISTGDQIREFDVNFYYQLVLFLVQNNYNIILVGVLGEENLDKDHKILSLLPKEIRMNILNMCNKTNITSLLEIFNSSDLFITPDTGTIHLAASLSNIKILGLYNISAYHQLTGAYSERAYFLTPNISCYPCEENFQICRERNNNFNFGIFECKRYFEADSVYKCVNYILRDEEIDDLSNLTFSKSVIDDKLLEVKVISGEKISNEKSIYTIIIKELLFRVDFKVNYKGLLLKSDKNRDFLFELINIYESAKRENKYSDFINYIKKNKSYKDLDFLTSLIC